MTIRSFLLTGLAGALFLAGPCPVRASDPVAEMEKVVSRAVRADTKVAGEASQWAGDRAGVLAEISRLKLHRDRLEHRVRKYRAYIQTQEQALAGLEQKQEALAKLNLELEPYLEEIYLKLEDFIRRDLPFQPEERQRRVDFLRSSLDDYHLELSEKLRRLMEALVVEAEYGNKVEKTEALLELEGGPTRVDLFRLGRLGLYYRTPDGSGMGWRKRGDEDWIPLDPSLGRTLIRAMEMADRQRAVELINLPLGRPEQ